MGSEGEKPSQRSHPSWGGKSPSFRRGKEGQGLTTGKVFYKCKGVYTMGGLFLVKKRENLQQGAY